MYGLKRIEYDEDHRIKAIEFYPDIAKEHILLALLAFHLPVDLTLFPSMRDRVKEATNAHAETQPD